VGFILGMQGSFNIRKSISIIHHINRRKKHRTLSIYGKKSIRQNPTPFHDKNTQQGRIEGNHFIYIRMDTIQTFFRFFLKIKQVLVRMWKNQNACILLVGI